MPGVELSAGFGSHVFEERTKHIQADLRTQMWNYRADLSDVPQTIIVKPAYRHRESLYVEATC